jgi:hypothetical protein
MLKTRDILCLVRREMVGSRANYHLYLELSTWNLIAAILKPFTCGSTDELVTCLQTPNFRLYCLFDERSCMDHLDATMRHWLERVELVRNNCQRVSTYLVTWLV